MDVTQSALSEVFRSRMRSAFGEAGQKWLSEIDRILSECASHWGLSIGDAYPNPSYQLVFPCVGRAGRRLALKLGVPRDELRDEAIALRYWSGRGTVKIIDDNQRLGALLLERIDPGSQLADVASDNDDSATEIGATAFMRVAAAGIIRADAQSPDLRLLPSLATWADAFRRYSERFPDGGPIGSEAIARASTMFRALTSSTTSVGILHGDLHHHNILRSGPSDDDWVVIDPKGIIGDQTFEAGAFLRNPVAAFGSGIDGVARTRRRIDILIAITGNDRERMIDWAWVGTVLSAVWCVEEDAPDSSSIAWPMAVSGWIDAAR